MSTHILFSEESFKYQYNYYHLLLDCLRPLYHYIGIHNFKEQDITVYFKNSLHDFTKEKLAELGFKINPLGKLPENSVEISGYNYGNWTYFIKKFTQVPTLLINKQKILVIKRNKCRILINNSELLDALEQNFKDKYIIETVIFDNKTIKEQIDMMCDCKILIGPHGAGFMNMLFLNENANVIEFFPESFYTNCFKIIAKQKKINHYYLHGKDLTKPQISLDEFISLFNEGKIWSRNKPTHPYASQLRDIKGFSINITDVVNLIKTIA
jgi:hypothetical protein